MLKKIANKNGIYYVLLCLTFLLGIFLRTKLFLAKGVFEDDECRLALSLLEIHHFKDFFLPLSDAQSAPPFFTLLSFGITKIFGYQELALKTIPYLAGLGSIFLFYKLCKNYLQNRWVMLFGCFIFSINETLISFATTFKQYSTDILVSLLCLLILPKLKLENLSKKQLFLLITALALLPLFSIPSVFFIGTFFALNIYANIKNKISFRRILACIIPFCIVLGLFYYFDLKQSSINMNAVFPEYWNDGFWNFSLKELIRLLVLNFKFYFYPNSLTLVTVILFFTGIWAYAKKKNTQGFFLICMFIFVLAAALFKIYPFANRVGLYFLPVVLLLTLKPLEIRNKIVLPLAIILTLMNYCSYNLAYLKNIASSEHFVKYSPDKLVKIIKENYNPQKDIILVNNASAASYLFYSGKNNFFSENVYEMLVRKNEEDKAINYLNSLENGHGYWIYMVKDYAKAQIFPLVLSWAKTEKVKQYYKEGESYLLYIER